MKKLLFIVIFLVTCFTAAAYDFSAVCSSGQLLYYTILNNKEVLLTSPSSSYQPSGDLVVPESVEFEGNNYSVVSVGNSAFYCRQGLTSVLLPNSIRRIEARAFQGCSALTSLIIGAAVDTIQWDAFKNCTSLQSIWCNTPAVPFMERIPSFYQSGIFDNVPTDIPVYVNCLAMNQYMNNPDWSRFTNMQGVFLGTPELTVLVNNPDHGTAEIVSVPEDCDILTATVRATANPNHWFSYWKKGNYIISFDSEYTFPLDENCSLVAYFDCSVYADTLALPDHVVGRKINSSGQVMTQNSADFYYDENGVMYRFHYPGKIRSDITFFEFPSKPESISTAFDVRTGLDENRVPNPPPVSTEDYHFYYFGDLQVSSYDHTKYIFPDGTYNNFYYSYDLEEYLYDNHRMILKDNLKKYDPTGDLILVSRSLYSYENGYKTQIESIYDSSFVLRATTTNQYDNAHRILSSQTDNLNTSGVITSSVLKTYTYTANYRTDSIVAMTMNDGEWTNSEIAHYVYDSQNRVIEYQTGLWSAENDEWIITNRVLWDYNATAQTITISFQKKNDNEWVWDSFSGQSLFNDPQLVEYQRQMNHYSQTGINQFEITTHSIIIEREFPILSEWYYEITGDDGTVTYQHLEYMSDTTINNDKPKVIVRTNQIYDKEGQTTVTHEYIKEQGGRVYWWNKELQEFTILYDYMAEAGDEWEIKVGMESIVVHVDSVGVYESQGRSRKVLHISDAGNIFTGEIIVGIGHLTSFFPEKLMVKGDYEVGGLRCYWVGDALLYHNGDEDCDAVYNVIHMEMDETETADFTFYPNPTDGLVHVEACHGPAPQEYRITNLMGQTLLSGSVSDQPIDVSSLPAGLYFLTLDQKTVKLIKQ